MYDVIVLGATFAASGIARQYKERCLVIERRAQAGYEFFGPWVLQWKKPKFIPGSKAATPCFVQNWCLCKKTTTDLPASPTVRKVFVPIMPKR